MPHCELGSNQQSVVSLSWVPTGLDFSPHSSVSHGLYELCTTHPTCGRKHSPPSCCLIVGNYHWVIVKLCQLSLGAQPFLGVLDQWGWSGRALSLNYRNRQIYWSIYSNIFTIQIYLLLKAPDHTDRKQTGWDLGHGPKEWEASVWNVRRMAWVAPNNLGSCLVGSIISVSSPLFYYTEEILIHLHTFVKKLWMEEGPCLWLESSLGDRPLLKPRSCKQ